MDLKVVIGAKDGKSYQKEIKEPESASFSRLKVGDKINGESIGMSGYEFEITGGSDKCGFPMRKDVQGTGRRKVLAVSGIGLKKKRKGQKQRKTVCGNTIGETIVQVNLKILKEGKEKLGEAKTEEKPADAPKEEKKEEAKPKEKKEAPKAEEKPADAPKEEKKEEAKPAETPKAEEKPANKPEESK